MEPSTSPASDTTLTSSPTHVPPPAEETAVPVTAHGYDSPLNTSAHPESARDVAQQSQIEHSPEAQKSVSTMSDRLNRFGEAVSARWSKLPTMNKLLGIMSSAVTVMEVACAFMSPATFGNHIAFAAVNALLTYGYLSGYISFDKPGAEK